MRGELPLPGGERVGVRGRTFKKKRRRPNPLTWIAAQSGLSPPGRGEKCAAAASFEI